MCLGKDKLFCVTGRMNRFAKARSHLVSSLYVKVQKDNEIAPKNNDYLININL